MSRSPDRFTSTSSRKSWALALLAGSCREDRAEGALLCCADDWLWEGRAVRYLYAPGRCRARRQRTGRGSLRSRLSVLGSRDGKGQIQTWSKQGSFPEGGGSSHKEEQARDGNSLCYALNSFVFYQFAWIAYVIRAVVFYSSRVVCTLYWYVVPLCPSVSAKSVRVGTDGHAFPLIRYHIIWFLSYNK